MKKVASFIEKIAKICEIKRLKTFPRPKTNSVNYYQTRKDNFGPRGPENLNNYKNVKKIEKNCKLCQKMLNFVVIRNRKIFHYI